jgi:hypothetical protein
VTSKPKIVQFAIGVFAATILWLVAKVVIFDGGIIQVCPIYDFADEASVIEITKIEAACRQKALLSQLGLYLTCCCIVYLLFARLNKGHK